MHQEMNKTLDDYERYKARFDDKEYVENYTLLEGNPNIKRSFLAKGNPLKTAINRIVMQSEIRALRKILKACDGEHILDVPCGSGKLLRELSRSDTKLIATDASKEMLKQAKSNCPRRVQLLLSDIRKLPFKDRSIDIVVSHRFFHRIPPQKHDQALRELFRINEKYLIIYFSIRNPLSQLIFSLEKIFKIGNRGVIHYMSSEKQIISELREAGWRHIKGIYVIPFFSTGYLALSQREK